MKQKIIKSEIYFLFLVTLLSFTYFYFQDSFPDSTLSISSNSESINFITYYLSSLVSIVAFYSGIWIFLPFIALAGSYVFLFSKRKFFVDVAALASYSVFFLFFSYIFAPSLIGEGLRFWISENINVYLSFVCTFVFFYTSMLICFRDSFVDFNKKLLKTVNELITKHGPALTAFFAIALKKAEEKFVKTKAQVEKWLTEQREKEIAKAKERGREAVVNRAMVPVQDLSAEKIETEEIEEEITEASEEEDETEILEDESELELVEDESDANVVAVVSPATKSKLLKAKGPRSNFISEDLISSLAQQRTNKISNQPEHQYFQDIIRRLEDKLGEFKIEAKVINILKGPVVDTFELELGAGVKVSRLTSIDDDLSLALSGVPIRMVYPMKGRTTVGIEIPRNPREVIYLDDVLSSANFTDTKHRLPIAMGKSSLGEVTIVDLVSMPHMLVAGSTGAGKSVFVNTLLVSLLVKMSPDNMKLILIDPKQLELALYSKLPHLMLPVITEAKQVSMALLWACEEMERRYSILREFGVRNIDGFNEKLKNVGEDYYERIAKFYTENDDEYELPYIVIIVDEFADLVLSRHGKEIENNIARLAAKARAAGIHLVLATQRPSVDVITGTIKNNFPSRVAFKVTSNNDSRTILNTQGAENLLGKGDMLFAYGSEIQRLHAAYVDENEIEALVDKLAKMPAKFNQRALEFIENGGMENEEGGTGFRESDDLQNDPLFKDAVRSILDNKDKGASASMLQRRFKIGYNRAANLIEAMESKGIIGPAEGAKPRKILGGADLYLE